MQEVQTFEAKGGKTVTLRPAVPDDAGQILDAVRSSSCERSYVLMEQYGKTSESERQFISSVDRQKNLILVAVADGQVVGGLAALQAVCGYRPESAHVVNVGLHLKDPYRGIGIGSRMLGYAVEWAKEKGFTKVVANIFTTNRRSLDLFIKAGFEEECIKRKQVRIGHEFIDEVCLARFLD